MNFCTKCGNQLKPDARFCGKCGEAITQVKKPEQPKPAASLVCRYCGASINPGVKFCITCGTQVAVFALQPPDGTHPPVAPPIKPTSIGKQLPVIKKRPKKRLRKFLVITFSITVILSAIMAGLYFYGTYDDHNSMLPEDDIKWPEYTAHPLVDGTTVGEKQEISVSGGNDARIILSDSSGVLIPGIKGNAKVELKKETNTIKLNVPGIETSGYMVSLTVRLSNTTKTLKPIITIPRSQVGTINPETVNMARISDVLNSDGQVINNKIQFLPVSVDEAGNYFALDYMFPLVAPSPNSEMASTGGIFTSLGQMFVPYVKAQNEKYDDAMAWVGNVKYCIITFQDDLNWDKNPRLVQMKPARNSENFRKPATAPERSERTKPVVNIIVLVHGHNEEEKTGRIESLTKDIWEFSYKRDLWKYLYLYYLDKRDKSIAADKNKEDDCTLFYEFIYPSYRPIFTPVPNEITKSKVTPHRTLGEDLGEALNKELIEKNPMVAKMIKNNIPFNIYFVSHSMGGLVSRAGLRYLDQRLEKNFRQLITWGTPHQGSPLTTLRYIMSAGFDVCIDGYAYYPDMYGNGPGWLADKKVIDAPGSRDLRWTYGSSGVEKYYNYDKFFKENSVEMFQGNEWNLRTGSKFFNENLNIFNKSETFNSRFTFFTGNIDKEVEVQKGKYSSTRAYYLIKAKELHGEIAIGAYFLRLLADGNTHKANDGASPVYSQGGFDLFPRPKNVDMGNMSHEDFYQSRGTETAAKTFEIIKNTAPCDCPYIDNYAIDKDNITAKLVWPNDPNPGKKIKLIEAAVTDKKTKEVIATITGFQFNNTNGTFSGKMPLEKENNDKQLQLLIKLTTKDGGMIEYITDLQSGTEIPAIGAKSLVLNIGGVFIYEDTSELTANKEGIANNSFVSFSSDYSSFSTCDRDLKWSNLSFGTSFQNCVNGDFNTSVIIKGEITTDNKCNLQISFEQKYDSEKVYKYAPQFYSLIFKCKVIDVPFQKMINQGNDNIFIYRIDGDQVKDLISDLKDNTVYKEKVFGSFKLIGSSYKNDSYVEIKLYKPTK